MGAASCLTRRACRPQRSRRARRPRRTCLTTCLRRITAPVSCTTMPCECVSGGIRSELWLALFSTDAADARRVLWARRWRGTMRPCLRMARRPRGRHSQCRWGCCSACCTVAAARCIWRVAPCAPHGDDMTDPGAQGTETEPGIIPLSVADVFQLIRSTPDRYVWCAVCPPPSVLPHAPWHAANSCCACRTWRCAPRQR